MIEDTRAVFDSDAAPGWAALLFERSLDGIVVMSTDGIILDANPAAERLSGLDRSAWSTRNVGDLNVVAPHQRELVRDHVRRCSEGASLPPVEITLNRPDGTTAIAETSVFPLKTCGTILAVAILRDITEWSRAFHELKTSEQRLQLAQEIGEMGDWSYDLSTREAIWSRQTYRLFGRSPESGPLSTTNLEDGLTPQSAANALEAFNRVAETGVGQEVELFTRPPVGPSRHLRSVIRATRDENGRVTGLVGTLLDITRFTTMKADLQRSEETLRAALNVAPVAIYVQNQDLVFTQVIEGSVPPSDTPLLGEVKESCTAIDELPELTALKRRVLETGERWRGDLAMSVADTPRVVDLSIGPHRDASGAVTGVITAAIDVTERRTLEDVLRQKNELLEDVSRSMGAGVAVISRDYKTLWANELLRTMYGDVEGLSCHWAYNRRTEVCPGCGVQKIFDEGLDHALSEQKGLDANGEEVWVQLVVTPVRDQSGRVVAAVEVVIPITERKKSEEALRLSENKYRGLFETIPDGIALVDPDGRIRESNGAYQQMLGYTAEELADLTYQDITPGKWHDWEAGIVRHQIMKRGFSDPYEKEYIRKDGTIFPVSVRGSLVRDQGGQPLFMWGIVRDISGQVRQEAEIRRLATAVTQAADAIVITDRDGTIQYVNPAFEQITGYAADDVIGRNPRVLKSGQHQDDFYRDLWATISSNRIWQGRLVNRRKDGQEYTEEMTITPVRSDSGECTNFVAIKRDISEQIALEARLNEEDVRRRILIERSSDGIAVLDEQGTILEANTRYADMLGYSVNELRNLHVWDFDARFTRDELVRGLSQLNEDGMRLETAMRRRDGSLIDVEVCSNAAVIAGRKVIFTVCRDISERIKSAEHLRMSEERYRTVAEHTHNWEYWVAPDGRFEYCSPSCERLTGYTREEFLANPGLLHEIVHPEDKPLLDNHHREKSGEFRTIDFRILTKTGEVRWIAHVCTQVFGENGRHLGRRASNQDITDRKAMMEANLQLERQFFQSQKMEAIGRLAGGVAHDFNNLLTVITGYGELLLKRLGDNSKIKSEVGEILRAAERASGLTRQLLTFSRRQVIQTREVDVDKLVSEMSKMLKRLIGEDIDYTLVNPGTPLWVMADPSQVEQIILNLAVNSRDAMPQGGRLHITLTETDLTGRVNIGKFTLEPGPFVVITVEDNGVGMDPDTILHIFEPFFTTKEVGQGTGLGLATVYGIVEQLSGAIDVSSRLNEFTLFTVYLPRVARTSNPEIHVEVRGSGAGRNVKILLVEDEPAVRGLIARMLSEAGHEVEECGDPLEALSLLCDPAVQFDLLLTDVVMPHMNGRQLAEQAHGFRPNLGIILMSGYADKMLSEEDLDNIGGTFIMKPFTQRELAARVSVVAGIS